MTQEDEFRAGAALNALNRAAVDETLGNPQASADAVVKRAQIYFDFLVGKSTALKAASS